MNKITTTISAGYNQLTDLSEPWKKQNHRYRWIVGVAAADVLIPGLVVVHSVILVSHAAFLALDAAYKSCSGKGSFNAVLKNNFYEKFFGIAIEKENPHLKEPPYKPIEVEEGKWEENFKRNTRKSENTKKLALLMKDENISSVYDWIMFQPCLRYLFTGESDSEARTIRDLYKNSPDTYKKIAFFASKEQYFEEDEKCEEPLSYIDFMDKENASPACIQKVLQFTDVYFISPDEFKLFEENNKLSNDMQAFLQGNLSTEKAEKKVLPKITEENPVVTLFIELCNEYHQWITKLHDSLTVGELRRRIAKRASRASENLQLALVSNLRRADYDKRLLKEDDALVSSLLTEERKSWFFECKFSH